MISDLTRARILRRAGLLAVLAASLSACNLATRLGEVGSAPELTPIVNPVQAPNYRRISLPMPRSEPALRQPNSLWRPGARAFFKDQRAALVGDILTINIAIADEATIRNRTTRSRNNSESAELTGIFGYEGSLAQVLPEAVNPGNLVDFGSQSATKGDGQVDRGEEINLTIAALVTQVLPNGNLVVSGSQEVRVNFEVRRLSVSGVVRPEDISASNTVNHSQIAEARIIYGGRGQISDLQQPRYGQQVFDILMPF